MNYGKLTVSNNRGTKDIAISDFMNSQFTDGRLVTIAGLEDESILINITNPEDSERNTHNQLWLSKESFFAVYALATAYCATKGLNSIEEALEGKNLEYTHSPNLSEQIEKCPNEV